MATSRHADLARISSLLPKRNSLTFRLLVGASLLCAAALIAAYVVLTALFNLHLRDGIDADLVDRVDDLAAGLQMGEDGSFALGREPDLPKYNRQLSGYYWQIEVAGEPILRSRSLWDARLPVASQDVERGQIIFREVSGPRSERLRIAQRTLEFGGDNRQVTFSVAADLSPALAAVEQFSRIFSATLWVLGVGLVSALILQVRIGLQPLDKIKQGLAAIRTGKRDRLADEAPAEIAPLVHELNALLDHHNSLIDRARAQAGDLAHALKTPLAVLRNEVESEEHIDRQVATDQITAMTDAVQHHLARARAAGSASLLGVRADAAQTITALARTLPRMTVDRELEIDVQVQAAPLWFAGEAQDLSEIVGNLLENACKWATKRIQVSGRQSGDRILIEIGDDGPGIDPRQRGIALQRGVRLDEQKPGSGLGLTIARDLAVLYGGTLQLGGSRLGGLEAVVSLPAASD